MYAAVEFEDKSCAVVPITWIHNKDFCYWPNTCVSKKQFRSMLEKFLPPLPKWTLHSVKIHVTCERFEDAERRLNEIVEDSTNSEMNDETSEPLYLRDFILSDEDGILLIVDEDSNEGNISNKVSLDDSMTAWLDQQMNIQKEQSTSSKRRNKEISSSKDWSASEDDTLISKYRKIKRRDILNNDTEHYGAAKKRNSCETDNNKQFDSDITWLECNTNLSQSRSGNSQDHCNFTKENKTCAADSNKKFASNITWLEDNRNLSQSRSGNGQDCGNFTKENKTCAADSNKKFASDITWLEDNRNLSQSRSGNSQDHCNFNKENKTCAADSNKKFASNITWLEDNRNLSQSRSGNSQDHCNFNKENKICAADSNKKFASNITWLEDNRNLSQSRSGNGQDCGNFTKENKTCAAERNKKIASDITLLEDNRNLSQSRSGNSQECGNFVENSSDDDMQLSKYKKINRPIIVKNQKEYYHATKKKNSLIEDRTSGGTLTPTNNPRVLPALSSTMMSPRGNLQSPASLSSSPRMSSISSNVNDYVFKERVIASLEKVSAVQDQLAMKVDQIYRFLDNKGAKLLSKPEDFPNLPIDRKEEFKELEKMLREDKGKFGYLRNRLAVIGGSNVRAATMNIMKFILTNKLGTKFNWAGNNNKRAFKNTTVMEVLKEAVYLNFSTAETKPSDLSDVVIIKAVQDWLRLALQRHNYKENRGHQ